MLFLISWLVFSGSIMVDIDKIAYLTKCTKEARRTYARAFGYPVPDFSIQVSASTLRGLATQLNKSIKGEGNELSIEYNDVKFCSPKKEVQ